MTAFATVEKQAYKMKTDTMRANVFHGVNDIRLENVTRPHAGPGEAVIRVTLTTICGTDLHIVRGGTAAPAWRNRSCRWGRGCGGAEC